MLATKTPENSHRIASTYTDKKLIALAWVLACTVVFLMIRH